MTSLMFIFIGMFTAIITELICGSIGIIVPLAALMLFYFSMTTGWEAGLAAGAVCGISIDMLYGRNIYFTPFIFVAVAAISIIWLRRRESKSYLMSTFPGMAIAALCVVPTIILSSLSMGLNWSILFMNMANLFFAIIFSAFFLPMLIIIMDYFSNKLGLPLFREANERITKA